MRVRMVVEIADCRPDFGGGSGRHRVGVIDGARHRCGRNLGFCSHLADVHRKETYHLSTDIYPSAIPQNITIGCSIDEGVRPPCKGKRSIRLQTLLKGAGVVMYCALV